MCHLSNIFGTQFCAEAEYSPNPNSPDNGLATYFAGPSKASLRLHKTDVFDKYIFKYEFAAQQGQKQQGDLKVSLLKNCIFRNYCLIIFIKMINIIFINM